MQVKELKGAIVAVIPDKSENKTASGIIIPDKVKSLKTNNVQWGVIAKKGTGTPWNRMDDIHLKQRIGFKPGAGMPYEEEVDGHTAKYLIIPYDQILFT